MKTRLQELRKEAGYGSARAFAEHIDMPVATYTDYEQGRRAFTLERAWFFADALGCTLDQLAGREFGAPLSGDAMGVARAYDRMDPAHRAIIDSVAALFPPIEACRLKGEI